MTGVHEPVQIRGEETGESVEVGMVGEAGFGWHLRRGHGSRNVVRGEDVHEGLDAAVVDGRPEHDLAALLHVLLVAGEGGRELRLEEEAQGVAGDGYNLGVGFCGIWGVWGGGVSANELDEGVAAAGLGDGVVRVVAAQLAVLCEEARAFELDAIGGLVPVHPSSDDELEELEDAQGPHPVAREVREQGEGEAHVLEADLGLWGVETRGVADVALELERGGVGNQVDGAEGDIGVHGAPDSAVENGIRVLEEDTEAGHGVLDGALLHGDLQLGLPKVPGPDDEAEGVGELLDLLGYEVVGVFAGVGEGLCGALDEERDAVLVLQYTNY